MPVELRFTAGVLELVCMEGSFGRQMEWGLNPDSKAGCYHHIQAEIIIIIIPIRPQKSKYREVIFIIGFS